jgi:hypothetical protein
MAAMLPPGASVTKLFYLDFMNFHNKLDLPVPGKPFRPSLTFAIRPRAV